MAFLSMVVFTCFATRAETETASTQAIRSKKRQDSDTLFSSTNVLRLQIEIPKQGMALLRTHQQGMGEDSERPVAQAIVKQGGRVYTNVAIHLKAWSSFRPVDKNPSLTLKFDQIVKGQTFHGLDKLSLNNASQDPSFLSEKVARELFDAVGVPVPRATFVNVELNGRNLGPYVLTEGFNKRFLKRYFNNTEGNLYEGGFLSDIDRELAVNSGARPEDQSDRLALVAAAQLPDRSRRFAELEHILDMDCFISFLAMETVMCHTDSYSMNKNNYRLFHDLDSDRMIFMPQGMDQIFGAHWRANAKLSFWPPLEGLVTIAVLQTPEGRARYYNRVSELATNFFNVATLTNRVNELAARIRPLIAERNPSAAKDHEKAVAALIDRIVQRGKSLEEQLARPRLALQFNASGSVQVCGWCTHTTYGEPELAHALDRRGHRLLYLRAGQGGSVGSWRTKIVLDDGWYRLEGRVKTQKVEPDPGDQRAGVGLRVSGGRFGQVLLGNSDWTNATCEFEVKERFADIELICEMRAAAGAAWFDADSLRLIRRRDNQ